MTEGTESPDLGQDKLLQDVGRKREHHADSQTECFVCRNRVQRNGISEKKNGCSDRQGQSFFMMLIVPGALYY